MKTINKTVSCQKDFNRTTANTILKTIYHQIKGEINRNEKVKTVFVRTSNRNELTFSLDGVTISVNIQEGGAK